MQAHPQRLKIVNPVMGDYGRMYSSLPEDMPRRMRRAPLSHPNMTGAWALLEELLTRLQARCALITGASIGPRRANV